MTAPGSGPAVRGLDGARRRARLGLHRARAAARRRGILPGSRATRPPAALLAALRRPRRPPRSLRRQLRSSRTWPLPADSGTIAWLAATARAHESLRSSIDRSVGGPPPVGSVTVVCATARPANLDVLLANHARQRGSTPLVLVTNSNAFDHAVVEARLRAIPGARHVHVDEQEPLGVCLNAGLELVTTRFAAKLDDDDWYGPSYLEDLLRAQAASGAAVTGKHSHIAHLADRDETVLRFPGREMAFTSFVAGGTLLLDLEQLGAIRFPALTVGEDKGLLEQILVAGGSVFSADRFSYVQRRAGDNTWQPGSDYLRRTVAIDPGTDWGRYDR